MTTLTIQQIKNLAEFAGMIVDTSGLGHSKEAMETEITLFRGLVGQEQGKMCAAFAEYHEEGSVLL